ncbi:hypothetical protein [Erwinia piriflorinigrans]|uniref:hypothetical protein n=1 Tax=Erwinia piriflorinigrans TaxID=665097 RepID=UPI000A50DDEF|nr:hypothetical protein [Erwinia piriflorinigrans]
MLSLVKFINTVQAVHSISSSRTGVLIIAEKKNISCKDAAACRVCMPALYMAAGLQQKT